MKIITIHFVTEFTDCPGGRHRHQGEFSGEEFRDDLLVPALRNHDRVILDLNGASGFASSFIDEAFGANLDRQVGGAMVESKLAIDLKDDPTALRAIRELRQVSFA